MATSAKLNTALSLATPLKKIKGIGPKFGQRLETMDLKTVQDALYHFPRRYEDFSSQVKISQAQIGQRVTIQGKLIDIQSRPARWRRLTVQQALITDGSGSLRALWFNKDYLKNTLKPGSQVALAGKIERDQQGRVLKDPEYEKIFSSDQRSATSAQLHTGRLVPIYEETRGITSRFLRWLIYHLLKQTTDIEEWLPVSQFSIFNFQFSNLKQALWQIHFPDSRQQAYNAKKRFEFEQLFLLQLAVLQRRQQFAAQKAPVVPLAKKKLSGFIKALPFELTKCQKIALWEILADMQKEHPMNRLLDGDVGTGKTVVAAIAAFGVVQAGFQAAFLAPTEVLASQHFQTFQEFFKKNRLKLELLTSSLKPAQKKAVREKVRQGRVDLVVGTHALLHKTEFKRLGLVVVDEQHRFGVRQRHQLLALPNDNDNDNDGHSHLSKVVVPHYLTMTATPIPRTLAMSVYGDLDISILDEFPKGRRDLQVKLVDPSHRSELYQFLKKKLAKGRQSFVIVPVIEKSESLPEISAQEVFEEFQREFAEFQVGLVHGRMKAEEKDELLEEFAGGKLDILVATTVVEVGLDVPGANLMLVKGAERFGLAQLHQLGGRIGRRGQTAYLFLEPAELTSTAKRRLTALTKIQNGFQLAEVDLKMRGPGQFLGERQSGWPDVAFEALKDLALVKQARQAAQKVLEVSADLAKFPKLQRKFQEFSRQVHLE